MRIIVRKRQQERHDPARRQDMDEGPITAVAKMPMDDCRRALIAASGASDVNQSSRALNSERSRSASAGDAGL